MNILYNIEIKNESSVSIKNIRMNRKNLTYIIILFFTIFSSKAIHAQKFDKESVIQSIIDSNVDLRSGNYIIYYKLTNNTDPYYDYYIKKHHLYHKSSDSLTHRISLPLLNDKQMSRIETIVDSLNIGKTSYWDKTNKYRMVYKMLNKEYCQFLNPIFSKNGKIAIVKYESFSGNPIGSSSNSYLMKKKKGKWINEAICGSDD